MSVPTIAAGSIAGHRVAVLAFDPAQSTWPLQLSYPVAVHDLVTFLADIAAPSAATNPSPPRLAPAQGPRALRFGRASVARRRQTQSSDLAWTFALAALVVLSVEWWYGSEWVGRRRWVRRGRDR